MIKKILHALGFCDYYPYQDQIAIFGNGLGETKEREVQVAYCRTCNFKKIRIVR